MNLIGTETVFMRQMQDTKQDKRNPPFPPISYPALAGLIGSWEVGLSSSIAISQAKMIVTRYFELSSGGVLYGECACGLFGKDSRK